MTAESKIFEAIRQARRKFVIKANCGHVGRLAHIDTRRALSEGPYEVRKEFLQFCDDCPAEDFDRDVSRMAYFQTHRDRFGTPMARGKCRKYKRLLESFRRKYFDDAAHAPVMVMDGGRYVRRLDGTHRISVLRYLGIEQIAVIAVTPRQYAEHIETTLSRAVIGAELNRFEKWYQAIEIVSGVWTRGWREQKEGVLVKAIQSLPNMAGKRVLDVGCNSGRYTFEAAMRGANCTGIDKRPEAIEQAQIVQAVWTLTKPQMGPTEFVRGNILDDLTLMKKFDVLLAACVLYHLGERIGEFMEAVRASQIKTIVAQGNRSRKAKLPAGELEKVNSDGVNKKTHARFVYDLPQLKQLMSLYGFREIARTEGPWPVGVYERA